jgi:predicted transcriptional regulator of viral defense system
MIMNYIAFRERFKEFTVFSVNDIASAAPGFHRRRLNDWQEKGYLKKIVKGYYRFSGTTLDENVLFEIANRIYAPSYISFETAFAYYGLIPEAVYSITSATTRITRTFHSPAGEFVYHTLKPALFFGYNVVRYGEGKHCSIASPEKAILDQLYINPSLCDAEDFEAIRFNRDIFLDIVNHETLSRYVHRFQRPSLVRRLESLREFVRRA